MMRLGRFFGFTVSAGIAGAFAFGAPAIAINASVLYLSIDNSGSIDDDEYDLQVQGWIDAFEFLQADPGYLNAVNPAYVGVSWWGSNDDVFEIPFQRLSDDATIDTFQAQLATFLCAGLVCNERPGGNDDGNTDIDDALRAGRNRINALTPIAGDVIVRRTIDISFDGFQNQNGCEGSQEICGPLQDERDLVAADGITINALPVPLGGGPPSGAQLITYAVNNIITTTTTPPGQTFGPASSSQEFEDAALTKLRFELVPSPASAPGLLTLLPLCKLRKRYRKIGREIGDSTVGDGQLMPSTADVPSRI